MTLHSTYSALGQENSAAVTKGRRKRLAERIEYTDIPTSPTCVEARLIGSCGHTLAWLARVNVTPDGPATPSYLTSKVGRRMTCQHNDCRIPPKS